MTAHIGAQTERAKKGLGAAGLKDHWGNLRTGSSLQARPAPCPAARTARPQGRTASPEAGPPRPPRASHPSRSRTPRLPPAAPQDAIAEARALSTEETLRVKEDMRRRLKTERARADEAASSCRWRACGARRTDLRRRPSPRALGPSGPTTRRAAPRERPVVLAFEQREDDAGAARVANGGLRCVFNQDAAAERRQRRRVKPHDALCLRAHNFGALVGRSHASRFRHSHPGRIPQKRQKSPRYRGRNYGVDQAPREGAGCRNRDANTRGHTIPGSEARMHLTTPPPPPQPHSRGHRGHAPPSRAHARRLRPPTRSAT